MYYHKEILLQEHTPVQINIYNNDSNMDASINTFVNE